MKDRSCLTDCAESEQEEATAGLSPSVKSAVDDNLIKAVRLALQSVAAQRASPAWAVLNIFYETALYDDDDERWAARFLRMTSKDYSLKWDVSVDAWSSKGSIGFSGHEIAQQCLRWIEKGWDFNTQDTDEDPCTVEAEDADCDWNESQTLIDQENDNEEFFPLPLPGEIVRRLWAHEKSGSTVLRYLDIRRTNHCDLYEYVVQEEGNAVLIAHSGGYLDSSMLKLLVAAETPQTAASQPYFIGASRWLDEVTKAALKEQESDHRHGFPASS